MSAARAEGRAELAWREQWSIVPAVDRDEERLLRDWIAPMRLEDLEGKSVLEAGCGSGQHTRMIARRARRVVAADLETAELAAARTRGLSNVRVIRADFVTMRLRPEFDVVLCIGAAHHAADPDAAFRNLASHVRPGGRIVLWVYSEEGNALMRRVVEPFKRAFLRRLPRRALWEASAGLTATLYLPVFTLYAASGRLLPYAEYFENWRRLSFAKNRINVFDKLNAPTTHFLSRARVAGWFDASEWSDVHLSPYRGVSWRASGTRRSAPSP